MAALAGHARARECVVFVDLPDPDNFVLVVCAALLRGARHVVVTGRPANFNVAAASFGSPPASWAGAPDSPPPSLAGGVAALPPEDLRAGARRGRRSAASSWSGPAAALCAVALRILRP